MKQNLVVVAMSGGVDSSVTALLLQKEGYQIVGATMKLIDDEKTIQSIRDAQEVCNSLGIEHHVFHLEKEFKELVINNFITSYQKGLTPNPCVVCNKHFKFGLFYQEAKKLGADFIATGHYAKIENGQLKSSMTTNKDQSYFLYGIPKEVLSHVLFPIADYNTKEEVREIAKKAHLSVSSKKDSQEVCFVPNDDYIAYLEVNTGRKIEYGNICLKDGTKLGKHKGLFRYTIGQRKGLGISYKEPLFVIKIDVPNNQIIVGTNDDLNHHELIAEDINLLVEELPSTLYAKVRSRGSLEKATINWINENQIKVAFENDQRAITPGQSVVFYNQENTCLGGAIIKEIRD